MGNQEYIERITKAVQELPTLPNVAIRVNKLLKSPGAGAAELAKVIELDISITAKLLSLVNSAYYGLSKKMAGVQNAVAYLGINAVSQLILSLGVLKTFEKKDDKIFNQKEFWLHSISVAVLSRKIARLCKKKETEECFTAGLLHDLGKITLAHFCPDLFELVITKAMDEKIPLYQIEKKHLGISHSTIGEWVARNWQLPLLIIVAIKHHHEEVESRTGFNLSNDSIVDIVRIADWLTITNSTGNSGNPVIEEPSEASLKRIPISIEEANSLAKNSYPEILAAAEILGV